MVQIRRIAIAIVLTAVSTLASAQIATYRQLVDVLRYGGPDYDAPRELTDLPTEIRAETFSFARWQDDGSRYYEYELDSEGKILRLRLTSSGNGPSSVSDYEYFCGSGDLKIARRVFQRSSGEIEETEWRFERTDGRYVERLFRSGSLSTEWIYELDEQGRPVRVDTVAYRSNDRRIPLESYLFEYSDPMTFRVNSMTVIDPSGEIDWQEAFSYDDDGHVRITTSEGTSQAMAYDTAGRLVEMVEKGPSYEHVHRYEYDESGRLIYEYNTSTTTDRGPIQRRKVFEYTDRADA